MSQVQFVSASCWEEVWVTSLTWTALLLFISAWDVGEIWGKIAIPLFSYHFCPLILSCLQPAWGAIYPPFVRHLPENDDMAETTLVRESVAYPCMNFRKSTVIHTDIHDVWMSAFNLHTSVDIHINIQAGEYIQGYPYKIIYARILMQWYSTMDYYGTWISTNGHQCFYGYQSSNPCFY